MAGMHLPHKLIFIVFVSFIPRYWLDIIICQVKSGTLFDNILICDDPDYAKKFAEETWGKNKDVGVLLTVLSIDTLQKW